MSFAALMIHTCTIETRTDGAVDGQGNTSEVPTQTTGVSCRVWNMTGKEQVITSDTVVASHKLYLGIDATISKDDRVLNVTDKDGTVLLVAADVEDVKRPSGAQRAHHIEAALKEVRV